MNAILFLPIGLGSVSTPGPLVQPSPPELATKKKKKCKHEEW